MIEYLTSLPKALPADKVLVHNHVMPGRTLGNRGFRAWLASRDDDRYELCGCGWAAKLGDHYRVA